MGGVSTGAYYPGRLSSMRPQASHDCKESQDLRLRREWGHPFQGGALYPMALLVKPVGTHSEKPISRPFPATLFLCDSVAPSSPTLRRKSCPRHGFPV